MSEGDSQALTPVPGPCHLEGGPTTMRYRPRLRRGLTLLEVIVSTAIFLIALVALVQLVSIGHENGRNARDQTDALQKAQAKLALVIAGDPDYPISTGG